ncbi:MAG: DUF294 nucleotidyltransferase-like domain-containing protein [Pyrinomonadaceae bacterium]
MTAAEFLTNEVPDPEAARRFLQRLTEGHPMQAASLEQNEALLSDVLTLVSCSPLFATTLLQNPDYIVWLGRERVDTHVRDKQSLLESLARFSLTHSQIDPQIVLARFRRRELMRIFLRDVRRLATIAEITEEVSNLADAILEHSLRLSRQELDNRFGQPQEKDGRGRVKPAEFCVISLGKLGSKELNYSSDIDLLFIFSDVGKTSGTGSRGLATNLEYFSKLAEAIVKLVGGQGGEGAAYRVDLRLRPHGRVGPLALPLTDTIRYYRSEAAAWERQVLIRSRSSAGSTELFRKFFDAVETAVFDADGSIETALENVSLSKQKIDLKFRSDSGIDIKLGQGGIREIEFIAQALQLAHGGRDRWLRSSHTLVSLDRLSDRGYLTKKELTQLFEAYDLLRRLEHILQIENGLQTHLLPDDESKQTVIAYRMGFSDLAEFRSDIGKKMADVNRIFQRVFASRTKTPQTIPKGGPANAPEPAPETAETNAQSEPKIFLSKLENTAPRFAAMVDQRPSLRIASSPPDNDIPDRNFYELLLNPVRDAVGFGERLCELRQSWMRCLIEIVANDVDENLSIRDCKRRQTDLAEASIEAAFWIMSQELMAQYRFEFEDIPLSALGLGKLGGGGMDYDSDLDLVMIYDDSRWKNLSGTLPVEFFAKAVEIFTTILSSVTRDGSLYRVDLRLRPYGSKGLTAISAQRMLEYVNSTAEIWELLAFVMLRAVGGDEQLGLNMEPAIRTSIFDRASRISKDELAAETRRIRLALEKQRAKAKRSNDVDIKYDSGGLLDVYFAARYLQLAHNVPNASDDRSTTKTLQLLLDLGVLSQEEYDELTAGYQFLASIDHNLRLVVGRTSRIPSAKQHALEVIAERMDLSSPAEISDQLTIHRLSIRSAFESIVGVE